MCESFENLIANRELVSDWEKIEIQNQNIYQQLNETQTLVYVPSSDLTLCLFSFLVLILDEMLIITFVCTKALFESV